jgi:hypothetical protein
MGDQMKPYLVAQERTTVIDAEDAEKAKFVADRMFEFDRLPDVENGNSVVRATVVENLPMYLNLADSQTVLGRATLYKDEITGNYRLDVHMFDHAAQLMEHLAEICDIKAIGFAGYLKENIRDAT